MSDLEIVIASIGDSISLSGVQFIFESSFRMMSSSEPYFSENIDDTSQMIAVFSRVCCSTCSIATDFPVPGLPISIKERVMYFSGILWLPILIALFSLSVIGGSSMFEIFFLSRANKMIRKIVAGFGSGVRSSEMIEIGAVI